MYVEISGEHRFKAPRDKVWELLLDPAALKAAMPGCERMEETGPEKYDITLKVGIAAIKGTYQGTVEVADKQPMDSFRLVVDGGGKPGKVLGDATMTLTMDGEETLVKYKGDVRAQGAIARLGSRLLGGAAKLMIGQFFKSMEKQADARVTG
jgi:carbon monoxide dehydrogenase subunit G